MHKELLKDIGEKELINRLAKFMPRNQTLDDCAFIKTQTNHLLINNDALVENVHFTDETISPVNLGWKAVASNISDLLSSGSKETIGITISLIMPGKTEWTWIKQFYIGANEALKQYGGIIIGGDCSSGKEKVISITALGIQGELEFRRNACNPGEIILTTGIHGLSKLGLMIKSKKIFDSDILSQRLINESLQKFCRPRLKFKLLKKLLKSRTNKKIRKIGCTDSSDGLFQALKDLSIASNCTAVIDYNKIPKHKDWPKGEIWDDYYFYGGEDYEQVFSLPKKWATNILLLDKNIREIGYFTKGKAKVEFMNYKKEKLLRSEPFRHF